MRTENPRRHLGETAVHVWTADLTNPALERNAAQCLSTEERDLAGRFRSALHRCRYEAGRTALRHILSSYVHQEPGSLRFRNGPFGKPELDLPEQESVHFNVTHSGDLMLCAVGRVPLGVDLETVARPPEMDAIAREFFSPLEHETLSKLAPADQALAFTRCWTRKEAFIKAIGEGLSHPLDAFEVTLAPHEPAGLSRIRGSEAEAKSWTIRELRTRSGYVGSLALAAAEPVIAYFRCPAGNPDHGWTG